jgi:predicted nucleic acid-binding protein
MVGKESSRPHFLDSSALVKRVIDEPGSDNLRVYFQTHSWFVTSPLCIAGALNVVKREWGKRKLTDQQYFAAVWELLFSYREGGRIRLTRENLADPEIFFGARELSTKYSVDFTDALQLYLLIRGSLAAYCDGSRAVHISADTALTH